MFQDMLDRIDTNTTRALFHLEVVVKDEQEEMERLERLARQRARKQAAEWHSREPTKEFRQPSEEASRNTPFVRDQPKVGQNEPCHCGSAKNSKNATARGCNER